MAATGNRDSFPFEANMVATKDQIFEFDNLDALWDEVKGLSQTRHLQVRGLRGAQLAQGAIEQINRDPRFEGFIASIAKYTPPGDLSEPTVFRIFRKPIRRAARVRISPFESVN